MDIYDYLLIYIFIAVNSNYKNWIKLEKAGQNLDYGFL